jgi:hypothetical protein
MPGLLETVPHTVQIRAGWGWGRFGMRMPVADKMQPFLEVLLDFGVLPFLIRDKPEPAALVRTGRAGGETDADASRLELRKQLSADFAGRGLGLAVRVKVFKHSHADHKFTAGFASPVAQRLKGWFAVHQFLQGGQRGLRSHDWLKNRLPGSGGGSLVFHGSRSSPPRVERRGRSPTQVRHSAWPVLPLRKSRASSAISAFKPPTPLLARRKATSAPKEPQPNIPTRFPPNPTPSTLASTPGPAWQQCRQPILGCSAYPACKGTRT